MYKNEKTQRIEEYPKSNTEKSFLSIVSVVDKDDSFSTRISLFDNMKNAIKLQPAISDNVSFKMLFNEEVLCIICSFQAVDTQHLEANLSLMVRKEYKDNDSIDVLYSLIEQKISGIIMDMLEIYPALVLLKMVDDSNSQLLSRLATVHGYQEVKGSAGGSFSFTKELQSPASV